jgi:FKBP-type peptidyl-prolyl cis-trans isomerase
LERKLLMRSKISCLLAGMALLAAQCGAPREQAPQVAVVSPDKQRLQSINKYMSEKEQDILQSYIARQQLDMQQSSTGYFYQLVEAGRGAPVANKDVVVLHGSILLIDGTPCYTYSERRPLRVAVGSFADINILNTALLGLRQGSRVRFVFPAHMAFGLLGDGDKIPPQSPLVCSFELAAVEQAGYSNNTSEVK